MTPDPLTRPKARPSRLTNLGGPTPPILPR
jgi:hypothetical protein